MQKPICYWVETPTIRAMCHIFGGYWEKMSDGDRYTIAWGITEAVMRVAQGEQRERLDYLCTQNGHQFHRHNLMLDFLAKLHSELGEYDARSLSAGILINGPNQ